MSLTENHESTEVPQGLNVYVSAIDSPEKPWFLTTTAVYDVVKKTISSIPQSKTVFDKSVDTIVMLTDYINDKTGSHIVIIDHERANELIAKLDGLFGDLLINVDDGFDNLRGKLATSVRGLIESLIQQKKLAVAKGSELVAQAEKARDVTTQTLLTRYEQSTELLKDWIEKLKARCPAQVTEYLEKAYQCYEQRTQELLIQAQATSNHWYDHADSRFTSTATYLLKTAQPYVHEAVQRGQPYLQNAVEVSQPYVAQAKPYFEPVLDRAQEMKQRFEENKLVGPYVVRVYATANKTLDQVKDYCLVDHNGVGESKYALEEEEEESKEDEGKDEVESEESEENGKDEETDKEEDAK